MISRHDFGKLSSYRCVALSKQELAATQNMKLEELYKKLGMEEQKLATQRQIEGTRLTLQQAEQALQAVASNLRSDLAKESEKLREAPRSSEKRREALGK